MDFRYLEPEVYVRLDLGPAAAVGGLLAYNGRWMRGDRARLGGGEFDAMVEGKDIVGAAAVLATAVDVEETAPGTYTGAVDLTRATEPMVVDDDQNAALGAKATALPFTTVLDAEGRLRSLRIDVPAAGEYPAQLLEMTYFDYGAATPPVKPAGDIVQAPDAVYRFFA